MGSFWTVYFINESENYSNSDLAFGLGLGIGIPVCLCICCFCITFCREMYDLRHLYNRPTQVSPPPQNLNIVVI
jgi:hypothetical protein